MRIVLEYVPNGSVLSLVQEGPVKFEDALKILADTVLGMTHLHASKVLHLDLAAR